MLYNIQVDRKKFINKALIEEIHKKLLDRCSREYEEITVTNGPRAIQIMVHRENDLKKI